MYDDKGLKERQQPEIFPTIEKSAKENIVSIKEDGSKKRAQEFEKLYRDNALPSGFAFDLDGWLTYQREGEDGEVSTPIKICSKLEVVARSRDQIGENHGRLLQFSDPDGVVHKWPMPMELLASDGSAYRQELLSKGLLIAPNKNARQLLTTYIQISAPHQTVRCIDHTGWSSDRTVFILQNDTIGNCDGAESLILQTTSALPITQSFSGTLREWQQIAEMCVGNSRLLFSVSAAFAPPLLLPLGMENGGVHFRGGSSSGKTTCLRAAASVWGGFDFLQQWRATANGLEGTAAAHNDCLLCLDEMGQMEASEIGKIAYMLANGVGKTRADKLGCSKKRMQWRLLFLSSGEISLADHMLEAKQKARAGQEVRVLDIPVDGQKYGCFEVLHGSESGKIFAERVVDVCKSFYGTAGPRFIECLLPVQKEIIQDFRLRIAELAKKYVPIAASGQVYRAFNRFALIGLAGELATSFGITTWQKGIATDAAMCCFGDWLKSRGDMGPQEERSVLSHVRHFFEQHGESRFSPWHSDEGDKFGRTPNRAGFRKITDDGEEFFVFRETFKQNLCVGFDFGFVEKICIKHGWLMPDPKGLATRSERMPGIRKSTRVYRFTAKVLESDE